MRALLLLVAAFLVAGCATVKSHHVRADYAQVDALKTKRLLVVTQPSPGGSSPAGELFSLVARRYVNQKRNFIVREHRTQEEPVAPSSVCSGGLEGVLWLKPEVERRGNGMEARLTGRLLRCGSGEEIWAVDAGGSFSTTDLKLREVTELYSKELGPEVAPYVPLAFNLLRPALDTLPNPVLTQEDEAEKIELGD